MDALVSSSVVGKLMEDYADERSWSVYTHSESDCVWVAENGSRYDDPCVMCIEENLTIAEARARRDAIELAWASKSQKGYAGERSWAVYVRAEDNKIWIDEDKEVCSDPLGYKYKGELTITEAREMRDRLKKVRRI